MYLIAHQPSEREALFDLAAEYTWVWQDEYERGERTPYQLIFLNPTLDTRILPDPLIGIRGTRGSGRMRASCSRPVTTPRGRLSPLTAGA